MNALREGFRAVQENVRALGVYAAIDLVFSLAVVVMVQVLPEGVRENPLSTASLAVAGANILILAFAQTLAFSWVSQQQGRPLWKLSTAQSFHEFFALWLIIRTIEASLWLLCRFVAFSTKDDQLVIAVLISCIPIFALTTPYGACVMHQGRLTGESLRHAFRVFVDLLPHALVVLMFNSLVIFFVLTLLDNTVIWAAPLVAVIADYFDIVVFAAGWSLATYHAHSYDRDDDLDF